MNDNGELKKWVIADKARNYDAELFALLLENEDLKKTFFKNVNGTLIFLLEQFLLFIEQKNYLNDSYTSYRNKIGLTIGGKFLNQRNEVELVWPYKDCILEGGQTKEDQKRPEIFFNETLAQDEITQLLDPKVLTNAKRYDKDGEHIVSEFTRDAELNKKRGLPENTITDNLIIKGNNLLALHSLKKEFASKVKLIYIDPPYNTGNDSFGYNDSFNHSTWLTFMKNRLEVAKTLLKDDGVIFVQCDQIEEAYLKVLMDGVFGNDKFINTIAIRSSTPSGTKTAHKGKTIIKQKDFILAYKKGQNVAIIPQYTRKQKWDTHFNYYLDRKNESVRPFIDVLIENKILAPNSTLSQFDIDNKKHRDFYLKNADVICQTQSHKNKEYKSKSIQLGEKVLFINKGKKDEIMFYQGRQLTPLRNSINPVLYNETVENDFSVLLCDFWDDIDFQNTQNEGDVSFPTAKKPEMLIYRIISLCSLPNDIILDFNLGSGTTASVAHKMNRQYIGIEQLDYGENDSVVRLQNVINGDQSGISKSVGWNPKKPSNDDIANGRYERNNFVYLELKKYNQAFIEQIEAANSSKKLLKIWKQMKGKSFLNYNVDIKTQEANIEEFKQLELVQQKQVLCELLDKNQLYVNVSDMNDERFAANDEEKKVTKAFYSNL